MKSTYLLSFLFPLGIVLFCGATISLQAYDSPDFDVEVFDVDGIYLPDSQKDGVTEALAAIASNFPGHPRVDSDLREKAIALSLRLNPLHLHSRRAHTALLTGSTPEKTAYFDSLSAISETLWTAANRLSKAPVDPEEQKLAPYILELSLLTHPSPPKERLKLFSSLLNGSDPNWGSFVTLQPVGNESTREARKLALMTIAPEEQPPAPTLPKVEPLDPFTAEVPEPAAAEAMEAPKVESFEPIEESLPCIVAAKAVDEIPVAGLLTLSISQGEPIVGDPELLPLEISATGLPLDHLEIRKVDASQKGWEWPESSLGVLDFTPASPLPGPRRVTRANADKAARLLISSALGSLSIHPDFALGIDFEAASPLGTEALETTLDIASSLEEPYLLLEETFLEPIVSFLLRTESLEVLFETELVSFTSNERLRTHLSGETLPLLQAASSAFAEIEAVSSKMPLPELARNAKVQERLEAIIVDCPFHLSARAMLAFGVTPVSTSLLAIRSKQEIDDLILPFKELDDPDFDTNQMKTFIEPVDLALSKMRAEIPSQVRDYHGLAIDLVEAAETYLSLSNRTTSTAAQRLREARDILTAMAAMEVELSESLRQP